MASVENNDELLVSNLLSDLFTLETQLAKTDSADLYKAYDREHSRGISVWVSHDKFIPQDPLLPLFLKRMAKISQISINIPRIFSVGLDPSGILFCVLESLDGHSVIRGNMDIHEAERRWTRCLQIAETLHDRKIPIGSIGEDSFWVTRTGDISLMGIMGSPAIWGNASSDAAMKEDAYQLCVIGASLFLKTNGYDTPISEDPNWAEHLPVMTPRWIKEVLEKGASSIPNRRYANILSVTEDLRKTKERILVEESQVQERKTTNVSERNKHSGVSVFGSDKAEKEEQKKVEEEKSNATRKKLLIVIFSFLLFLIFALLIFLGWFLSSSPEKEPTDEFKMLTSGADQRMQGAIDVIANTDTELMEKRAKFQELQDSDDPLANGLLVEAATTAGTIKERLVVEGAILGRSKRLGVMSAIPIVKAWLDTTNPMEPPAEYGLVLRSIDPTIPNFARAELIERAFSLNRDLSLRLLAGFVLDNPAEQDVYKNTVHTTVANMLGRPVPEWMSPIAALALIPDCYATHRTLFEKSLKLLTPQELKWMVTSVLEKDGFPEQSITDEAIKKYAFGTSGSAFLRLLSIPDPLPEGMLATLGRLLEKKVTINDVEQLGAWIHPEAVMTLKGILLIPDLPKDVASETVEYIAGKESEDNTVINYVRWLQNSYWEQRAEWSLLLGVISSNSEHSDTVLKNACAPLKEVSDNDRIFSLLLGSNNQSFIEYYLNNFRDNIPSGSMVSLLSNEDPRIRISAIKSLRSENSTSVLQLILASYHAEKDPNVKKVYEDELWIVKQTIAK